jgi:hypothetical protein
VIGATGAEVPASRLGGSPTNKEALMALARVVTFDGVSKDRIEEMTREMNEGDKPEGLDRDHRSP